MDAKIRQTLDLIYRLPMEDYIKNHFEFYGVKSPARKLVFKKKYWGVEYLSRVEKLIITKSWWDTVDGLVSTIAGLIFSKDAIVSHQWIEKWNNSDDNCFNRSALIHQLRYKSDLNLDLLFILVETHIGSKELYINNAAGCSLRQESKFHPAPIKDIIENHPDLSNLTKREGRKYL